MTILPKKKSPQNSAASDESNEASSSSGHAHQLPSIATIPNHIQLQQSSESARRSGLYLNSQSPPPCWPPPPTSVQVNSREEKRPGHSSPSHYEEAHDAPTSLSKRRYRASPLRSVRPKHRDHRGSTSPPYPSTSGGWNVSSISHNLSRAHSLQIAPNSLSSLPAALSPQAGPSRPSASENDEDYTGYNSGDEYEHFHVNLTKEQWEEKERWFEKKMNKKKLIIKKMREDGACLFRAVADQIFGDEEMHGVVRKRCMDYILQNEEAFAPFVSENFHTYVERKKREDCFGNHIEIAAMSELFNRVIEVYCYSVEPINIFQSTYATDNAPIRLSYHGGTHYNSVVDPFNPTIGVGLGLPEFHPGMADRNLLTEAAKQSENLQLEQAMLEDKIRATDYEATTDAIEEQVAHESYMEWLRQNKHSKAQWSPSGGGASSSNIGESRSTRGRLSPHHQGSPKEGTSTRISPRSSPRSCANQRNSPAHLGAADATAMTKASPDLAIPGSSKDPVPSSSKTSSNIQGFTLNENSSFLNQLPLDMFGLSDYASDEMDMLAQVLAASQQEYLDSLKSKKEEATAAEDPSSSPKPSSSNS